jgi:hypothetical protein
MRQLCLLFLLLAVLDARAGGLMPAMPKRAAKTAAMKVVGTNVFSVTARWTNQITTNYVLRWGTNSGDYPNAVEFTTTNLYWKIQLTNYTGPKRIAAFYFRLTSTNGVTSTEGRYPDWPANRIAVSWLPSATATLQQSDELGMGWKDVATGTNAVLELGKGGMFRTIGTNVVRLSIRKYHDPTVNLSQVSAVTLAWTPSQDTNVVNYSLYSGPATHSYTNAVDAGTNTTVTLLNLVKGVTYYFAVTAKNGIGMESDFSNEVQYAPPVRIPLWIE